MATTGGTPAVPERRVDPQVSSPVPSGDMYKAYQPLRPATNKYLQMRWDQAQYEEHRTKVKNARPVVDTKGAQTPAHVQLKLKKLQLEDEKLAIVERDNQLLASKLADIVRSKGMVDHRNDYPERSLNAERRREELLKVTRENQAILHRLTGRQSDYRRPLWEESWEKVERRRDDIAKYPRGVSNKQRSKRKVTFVGSESETERSTGTDNHNSGSTGNTDTEEQG